LGDWASKNIFSIMGVFLSLKRQLPSTNMIYSDLRLRKVEGPGGVNLSYPDHFSFFLVLFPDSFKQVGEVDFFAVFG
jgi:hypothetical protein